MVYCFCNGNIGELDSIKKIPAHIPVRILLLEEAMQEWAAFDIYHDTLSGYSYGEL